MTTRTRNTAPALSAAEREALTSLERDGWEIQYSPFLRRWTLKRFPWTTCPHQTPGEACEAAQKLQDAAAAALAEQERQRDSLRAYLERGRKKVAMHTIYTIGYAGWKPEELKAQVDELGAMLIDIRYSPRSRRPEWNREALRGLWGQNWERFYLHLVALGNRNYKSGGAIELAAPEVGLKALAPVLRERPIVLLCACRDADMCHRSVAADFLSERLGGIEVVDLSPAGGRS